MVSVNLAFSLARSPNCRTVLIDLDLKRPSVARVLGVEAKGSVGEYLSGKCRAEDCFIEVGANLIVATSRGSLRNSSELIHGEGIEVLLKFVSEKLAPDIVLFDLPPMQVSDDTIAFLPMAEAALLVIAAGRTSASEVVDCERQIEGADKLIGVVLNKCEVPAKDYYDYY
jgi:protein-tyrosine kinase